MAFPAKPQDHNSSKPADTADTSNNELMDVFQQRGARSIAALEASRHERKHDVDRLSDRDLERLTISLKRDDTDEKSLAALQKEEERKRFDQYRHHSFVAHWKPLSPEAPLDEEWFIADPVSVPDDDAGFLCEMCRHIDFNVLLTQRGLPGNNLPSAPTQISLYAMGRVMQEDNKCSFCRLLREKITRDKMLSRMTEDETQNGHFFINVLDQGPDYALRLELELEPEERRGGRFVVQRIDEDSQQPLAGRLVQQHQADMDRLREWLCICEKTHQSPTNVKSLALDLASLRLIDTDELRIREVEMPCRYACLSYVWGKGSQTQYTVATKDEFEAPGALQAPGVNLPQTIKDAIKVTQEAGLRYLWVDALCIIQDDPKDMAEIISKMGHIYGGATLTIVASTNTDPQQGLPGMGTAPRTVTQKTAKINGITLAVALDDPRQPIPDLESSVWNSRAWTFQERALSTRAVHFTRSQMVFKCVHGAVMLEETAPTPDPDFVHSAIADQLQSDMMALIWSHPSFSRFPNKGFATRDGDVTMMSEEIDLLALKQMTLEERNKRVPVFDITVEAPHDFMGSLSDAQGSTPWDMYRRAVDDYTKRELSWEIDAVDAFAGVEHLIRRGINTKFWFGLPSFAFEQALVWQTGGPLRLRSVDDGTIFPSWSWAAWKGHVFYRGRGWKNSVLWDSVSVVRWYVREESQWFINHFKKDGTKTEEEIEVYTQQVNNSALLLRGLDHDSLHHLDAIGKDGWVVGHDEQHNRHIYTHDAYQGVTFTSPVNLPDQAIDDRPDMNGTLFFTAHVVPIVPCDIQQVPFKQKLEDDFLQLGINDESRSANYRPPWQRIIYHQGYRAGFLTLNKQSLLTEDEGCEYHLAAISRGSLPHVPPPVPGWDAYWDMDPRTIQDRLFYEEWCLGPSRMNVPDETVEPLTGPHNEDGDPHWDTRRFNGMAVFDIYDVLLLRTRSGRSMRVGAGKVNFCAFVAARPKEMLVKLV